MTKADLSEDGIFYLSHWRKGKHKDGIFQCPIDSKCTAALVYTEMFAVMQVKL